MITLKEKIGILEKMGAEVQIISRNPLMLKVEKLRLIKNLGIKIIVSSSDETEVCPEEDWNCEVEEKGYKKFILKFNIKP